MATPRVQFANDNARYKLIALTLAMTFLLSTFAVAADRGPSTPEERQRIVAITERYVQDPLNPAYRSERSWAISWVEDVPDVEVRLCGDILSPITTSNYAYSRELVKLHMLAQAAYVIQHPEKANDEMEINLAATNEVLDAYDKIVAKQPGRRSHQLDQLRDLRDKGQLVSFVREQVFHCTAI